jgi:tape measure domain-containing protein
MNVGILRAVLELDASRYDAGMDKAERRFLGFGKQKTRPAQITADTGDATSRLDTLRKNLTSLTGRRYNARVGVDTSDVQRAESTLSRLKSTLTAFAGGYLIIRGIGEAFRFLKDATLDFSSSQQQASVGFETALRGNLRAVRELQSELNKFAIPTPFEAQDLFPLAQQTLSFKLVDKDSVNMAKEVVGVLRDAGDAAFGLNRGQEGVNRFILALGQIRTQGKATGQDMLQLTSLGVAAWDYLAEATGKTTGETKKLVSEGLIPADQAIKAIRAGVQRDFGGAMESAAKTWQGSLSQIRDTARMKLSDLFAPAFASLTEFSTKAAKVLGTREFDMWFADFTGKIKTGFAIATGAVDGFTDMLGGREVVITAILTAIGARFLWLGGTAIVGGIGTALGALQSFAVGSAMFGVPLLAQIALVAAAVAAFAVAYSKDFAHVRTITDTTVEGINGALSLVSVGFAKYIETVSGLVQGIPGLGDLHKKFFGDQTGLAAGVQAYWDEILAASRQGQGDFLGGWSSNFRDEFSKQWRGIFPDIDKALKEADEAAKKAQAAAGKGATVAMPHIDTDAGKKSKPAEEAARRLARVQKDALGDAAKAWREYGRAVEGVADKQIEKIRSLRDSVVDLVQSLESKLVAADARLMGPFYKMVENLRGKMGDESLLNAVYDSSRAVGAAAERRATSYDSQREKIELKDGVVSSRDGYTASTPGGTSTSVLGARIADKAAEREVSGFSRGFKRQCQALAETTLWAAGVHEYDAILKPKGSALQTLRRFQKAGMAQRYAPGMALPAGSLAYSETMGSGFGHVATIGPNGEFLDQYGKNKLRQKNYQYFVPPPGARNVASGAAGSSVSSVKPAVRGASVRGNGPDMPPDYDQLIKEAQRPEFKQAYTQYSQSTLQELLKLHPVEKEGNEIRREQLLTLVKLNPKLHEYAANKGLAGKAAENWVKQVRAALYSMAEFTEAVVNQHEAEQRNAQQDEERVKSRVSEVEAMKARSAALVREGELLENNALTMREVNRIREEEKYILAQMAHYEGKGYSPTTARLFAGQDADRFRSDQTQQDDNEAQRQARQNRIDEASDMGEKAANLKQEYSDQKADEYFGAFRVLSDLLGEATINTERLNQALSELPAGASMMPGLSSMMGTARHRAIGGDMLDNMRAPLQTIDSMLDETTRGLDELRNRHLTPFEQQMKELTNTEGVLAGWSELARQNGIDLKSLGWDVDTLTFKIVGLKDGLITLNKETQDAAFEDAFKEIGDARKLLNSAPGFARDQASYRMQLENDKRFKGNPEKIDALVNDRGSLIRQGNAADWADDLKRRIEYATADTELDRWMLDLKAQWKRDGFSDEEVKAMLPFERALKESETAKDTIRGHADDMKNILSGGIQSAFKGDFEGGLKGIISSFSERMMQQMADNIAQGWTEKVMRGPWQQAGGAGQIFPQQPGGFLGFGGINGIAGPTLAMAGAKPAEPKKPKWYETIGSALGLPMGASGAMAGGAAGGNGNAIITIQNATITTASSNATIGSMNATVSFAMINAQGGMGGGSGEAGSSPSGDQLGEGILGGLLSGSGGLASKLFRN